jgi:hypothetical protein
MGGGGFSPGQTTQPSLNPPDIVTYRRCYGKLLRSNTLTRGRVQGSGREIEGLLEMPERGDPICHARQRPRVTRNDVVCPAVNSGRMRRCLSGDSIAPFVTADIGR